MIVQTAETGQENGVVPASENIGNNEERKLGMRFICRRNDGDFWYVQIRVMTNGTRYALPGKSFYDHKYGGKENALTEAIKYRDSKAKDFFDEVGYENVERKKKAPKIPKFKKRKEATSGLLANLHYIHLYKRNGKYTRCVVDVSVNVHGIKYHSTAYSYDFAKYGGKASTIKIAKNDRNRLANLVHTKAMELNQSSPLSEAETKRIIKGIRINRTPPTVEKDPDMFIKRSYSNDYWIVNIRKKLWGVYYRVPSRRFYDNEYGGRHKSRIHARLFTKDLESVIEAEFDALRGANIRDGAQIKPRFLKLVHDYLDKLDQS